MAIKASGSNVQLTFIEETTWAETPVTPQMKVLRGVTSESLGASQEQIKSVELNPFRSTSDSKPGQRKVEGDINFELGIHGAVSLLARAMGNVVTSGTGPYTHVLSVSNPKSLTVQKFFNDIVKGFVFRGLYPNTFNITANPEGAVTGTIGLIGKYCDSTSTKLDTTPTELSHGMYDGIRATATIDGTGADFQALSLSITNNLKDYRSVGSDVATSITPAMFDVTGAFTVAYGADSQDLIDNALSGTPMALLFSFTNGAHSITFNLPRILVSGDPVAKSGSAEQVNLELNYEALLDNDAESATYNKSIVITVVSDEAIL